MPLPKGGAKRAFDIPLSRPMIKCLVRAMRAGPMLLPRHADKWIFVAESAEGHLVVHKERRDVLSKYGNDLRQTYRTLGQAAGLSEVDMHLLMAAVDDRSPQPSRAGQNQRAGTEPGSGAPRP